MQRQRTQEGKTALRSQSATSNHAPLMARAERLIVMLRGRSVMLSPDLAELYSVEPRALLQAVKRNLNRFPADFMFQLDAAEYANLKSQFVISSWGGARRALPYAFTEQGVAMLSSVLRSERAVQVNIAIMRAFVRLREMLLSNADLARRLDALEQMRLTRYARSNGTLVSDLLARTSPEKFLQCPLFHVRPKDNRKQSLLPHISVIGGDYRSCNISQNVPGIGKLPTVQ